MTASDSGRDRGTGDASRAPAIALEGAARRMGRETVLDGIDLEIAPGRVVVLRGANGAGKTTLLRMLATRLRPTRGSGRVFGFDLVTQAAEVRRRVGLLSVLGGNYPVLTARENLRLAMALSGGPDAAAIDDVLDRVRLEEAANKLVRTYSSGMKKRLGLARLLLRDPDLWLLDEPYAALDDAGKRLVDEAIRRGRQAGRTVLMASHESGREGLAPDAVLELAGGRVQVAAGGGE
ncbi:MAG: heme ABC exporter ATP-binding protein CcmA [Trueperaceae bacterium]